MPPMLLAPTCQVTLNCAASQQRSPRSWSRDNVPCFALFRFCTAGPVSIIKWVFYVPGLWGSLLCSSGNWNRRYWLALRGLSQGGKSYGLYCALSWSRCDWQGWRPVSPIHWRQVGGTSPSLSFSYNKLTYFTCLLVYYFPLVRMLVSCGWDFFPVVLVSAFPESRPKLGTS